MRTEAKHTPAPWTMEEHGGCFYIFGPDAAMVADNYGWTPEETVARIRGVGRGATVEEQTANGHLIRAAPALLEACQDTLAWLDSLEIGFELARSGSLSRAKFLAPHRAKLEAAILLALPKEVEP